MSENTDIWMPLYIGDYLADTSHLDAEWSGAYLHILMHYWRKGPLPDDLERIISITKLRSTDAPSITQALLTEFFSLNGDGRWHQKRQDIEIKKWHIKQQKAKEKAVNAAKSRWRK